MTDIPKASPKKPLSNNKDVDIVSVSKKYKSAKEVKGLEISSDTKKFRVETKKKLDKLDKVINDLKKTGKLDKSIRPFEIYFPGEKELVELSLQFKSKYRAAKLSLDRGESVKKILEVLLNKKNLQEIDEYIVEKRNNLRMEFKEISKKLSEAEFKSKAIIESGITRENRKEFVESERNIYGYKAKMEKPQIDLWALMSVSSELEIRKNFYRENYNEKLVKDYLTKKLGKSEKGIKVNADEIELIKKEAKEKLALLDVFNGIRLKMRGGEKFTKEEVDLLIEMLEMKKENGLKLDTKTLEGYQEQSFLARHRQYRSLSLDITKPKNGYPDNCMIAASCGQRHVTFGDTFINNILYGLSKVKSLPDAAVQVQRNKAMVHQCRVENTRVSAGERYEVPAISTKTIDCWNKDEKCKRVVIYIEGYDADGFAGAISYDDIKSNLKKNFDGEMIFHRLHCPKVEDVKKKFDEVSKKVDKDTEVLVIVKAHGGSYGMEEGIDEKEAVKEGGMLGLVSLTGDKKKKGKISKYGESLRERTFKEHMQKLKHAKGCFILIHSCHSGAWVADNNPLTCLSEV